MNKVPVFLLVGLMVSIGQLSAADALAPSAAPMPMPMNMPMGNTTMAPKAAAPAATTPPVATGSAITPANKTAILSAYLKISAALAADNLADAKAAATALTQVAGKAGNKDIATQATTVGKGADIAAARKSFETLSATVETLVAGDKTYIVMYCPMVKADWIQTTKEVKNPYQGKAMLDCGGPKATK